MSRAAFSTIAQVDDRPRDAEERRRDGRYPISRWWLRPLAVRLAARLADSPFRPGHFTFLNLAAMAGAVLVLGLRPEATLVAAGLVGAAWCCDRLDGALARAQRRVSPAGAWLDGNLDELGDLALHAAMAGAAARVCGQAVWIGYGAFLFGKYLLMYGLQSPEGAPAPCESAQAAAATPSLLRTLYHLPANADVRVHVALAALIAGAWNPACLALELAAVAAYYNLRWMVRYVLVLKRGV